MRLRSIFATGLYLSLIPLVGATGTWTEPMAAAPFAEVEAPALTTSEAQGSAQGATTSPPIHAGRLEQRDASVSLSKTVTAIGTAETGTVWLAWTTPAQRPPQARWQERSWSRDVNRCVLDDDGNFRDSGGVDSRSERIVIFARMVNRSIDRLALADMRCTVDAGAKTVYFLEEVQPAQSVALLANLVRQEAADKTAGDSDEHGRGTTRAPECARCDRRDSRSVSRSRARGIRRGLEPSVAAPRCRVLARRLSRCDGGRHCRAPRPDRSRTTGFASI